MSEIWRKTWHANTRRRTRMKSRLMMSKKSDSFACCFDQLATRQRTRNNGRTGEMAMKTRRKKRQADLCSQDVEGTNSSNEDVDNYIVPLPTRVQKHSILCTFSLRLCNASSFKLQTSIYQTRMAQSLN